MLDRCLTGRAAASKTSCVKCGPCVPEASIDRETVDEQDGGYGVSIESTSPGQKSRRDVGITWRRLKAPPLASSTPSKPT